MLLLGRLIFAVPIRGHLFVDVYAAAWCSLSPRSRWACFLSTPGAQPVPVHATGLFTFLPQILLSGFMFPYAGMPRARSGWPRSCRSPHPSRLIRGIALRAAGLAELWPELAALGAFTVVLLGVSVARVHKRLDWSRPGRGTGARPPAMHSYSCPGPGPGAESPAFHDAGEGDGAGSGAGRRAAHHGAGGRHRRPRRGRLLFGFDTAVINGAVDAVRGAFGLDAGRIGLAVSCPARLRRRRWYAGPLVDRHGRVRAPWGGRGPAHRQRAGRRLRGGPVGLVLWRWWVASASAWPR